MEGILELAGQVYLLVGGAYLSASIVNFSIIMNRQRKISKKIGNEIDELIKDVRDEVE